MNCTVCDSPSAIRQEEKANDHIVLRCEKCGEVIFTSTAFIELESIGSFKKKQLQEYCRVRYKPGQVIDHATLGSL